MKKKKDCMSMKLLALAICLLQLMTACGGNGQKVVRLQKVVKDAVEASRSNQEENLAEGETSDESASLPDGKMVYGLEIPVAPKNLSQTIKQRTSYTVSYNHDTREPNWVAWVLTAEHASGKVQRMDFADDDDMPAPKGTLADYYNSGFDRGHMCPAGDNKWSEKAMQDCFLITNMCPQDGGLNRGVWNSIEQQCRSWAKEYGKVYVVCGPVYLNKQHRKLGKNKVVVPDAFFKVVLCMEGKPKAIGFICRNQTQKGKKKTDFVNSVDEVERITGYDFFSKLPDGIEKKVEAHADINEW